MYCKKCGKEINDDAAVCIHCGVAVEENNPHTKDLNESKTAIGVVMGLFLGIIGLIIGICLYPSGTVARKTFIKAWGITFGVCVGIAVILTIVIVAVAGATVSNVVSNMTY